MNKSISVKTNMRLLGLKDIGLDYAETLRCWKEQFNQNLDHIRKQGFSESFIRMWDFYFCYCEGGFRERVISDVHMHLVKPLARVPSLHSLKEE